MFEKNTVFILGAGASRPYGYPLGKALIEQIIKNISDDDIYLPIINVDPPYYYNHNDRPYDFYDFENVLKEIDYMNIPNEELLVNPSPVLINQETTKAYKWSNYNFIKTKISKLKQFNKLLIALRDFNPVSIDIFLRDHDSYAGVGKTMIIYSLLKCEKKNAFSLVRDESVTKRKSKDNICLCPDNNMREQDNWYSYLINDMLAGCETANDILNKKFNIITFNYSLDLDYCILKKIKNVGRYKDEVDDDFMNGLESKIHHVYGKLHEDDVLNEYGRYSESKNPSQNTKRFLRSLSSAGKNNIKLIGERTDKHCQELINDAEELITIGFGFDRQNMDILGFQKQIDAHVDFFNGKLFKYMDYEGRMKSLYNQFLAIEKKCKGANNIHRSTAKTITDAYQNDFKLYLY